MTRILPVVGQSCRWFNSSDVNHGVHLLNDGWLDAYDCSGVARDDSDIAETMRPVCQHCGKRIGSSAGGPVSVQQIACRQPEGAGDPVNVDKTDIAPPALYAADVGLVEATKQGQVFLGIALGVAKRAQALTEAAQQRLPAQIVHDV